MPLSPPQPREHLHTRRIECRGYRREDGLWDIEGHIVDTKSYDFPNEARGEIKSGTPVHDMWIRLTIDAEYRIHDVEAVTAAGPYRDRKRVGEGKSGSVRVDLGGGRIITKQTQMNMSAQAYNATYHLAYERY